jgi:ABC-type oligopeptide transport system substrate-binding subunit
MNMLRGRTYVFLSLALALLLAAVAAVGCGDSGGTTGEETSPVRDTSPAGSQPDAGDGKAQLLLFTQPG